MASRKAVETQLRALQEDLDAEQRRYAKLQAAKKRNERDTEFVKQALQNSGDARVALLVSQLEEKSQQLARVRPPFITKIGPLRRGRAQALARPRARGPTPRSRTSGC